MIKPLATIDEIKDSARKISELIDSYTEWIFSTGVESSSISLRKTECDARVAHNRLVFTCFTDKGVRSWHIVGWHWTGDKLLLDARRRMGAEQAVLEMVPRTAASEVAASISLIRQQRALEMARLAATAEPGTTIHRAGLSLGTRQGQPGRYARIILQTGRERIAVTGIVTGARPSDTDSCVSSAILWFRRTQANTRKFPVSSLWLVVEQNCREQVGERLALLRPALRDSIRLYEVDEGRQQMSRRSVPALSELIERVPDPLRRVGSSPAWSGSAAAIVELATDAIDVIRRRHGETLRFHGLPFARVGRVMERERVWFGIETGNRRPLDERSHAEWSRLTS